MCGVVGFACNRPTKSLYNLVTNLMIETEQRGPHATGHAYFDKKGKIKHKKAAVKSSEYVTTSRWNWMQRRMPKRVIGHCRYTTHGSQSDNNNNHPHVGDRYALIHNGVLKRYEYKPWAELCESECDSEAILRVMELGQDPIQAAARVFNCFYESNLAVLALDKLTKEIHFFRNPGRPLRVWRGDKFVLIASTEEILEAAFQKTFDIKSDMVKGLEKWSPVSGTAYTLNNKLEISKKELFDFTPALQAERMQTKSINISTSKTRGKNLPDKVLQYQQYGKRGNSQTVVDRHGNIVYSFDH